MFTVLFENESVFVAQSHTDHHNAYYNNMALHVADTPSHVLDNRARFLQDLYQKAHIRSLLWLNQVHGDTVFVLQDDLPIQPPCADAAITQKAGVGLCIMTADCVPIVLFDGDTIANIHAGWQGLANGIIAKTKQRFSQKTPIYAYIGACIGQACYEIPTDLAQRIIQNASAHVDFGVDGTDIMMPSPNPDKVLFSVGALAQRQLLALGVQIINPSIACSYTAGMYFSHRKAVHQNQVHTGRMAMVIAKRQ